MVLPPMSSGAGGSGGSIGGSNALDGPRRRPSGDWRGELLEHLLNLDQRWLAHPGYSVLLPAALIALADPLAGCLPLRALVTAFAAGAVVITVLLVHRDRLSERARRTAPLGLCLASAALALGLVEAAAYTSVTATGPGTFGLLAMAVGAYLEHARPRP